MAISNGYATLAEIQARLGNTLAANESILENMIEAASRWIDAYCGRRFYRTANDETRVYTASDPAVLGPVDGLDDVGSITTLKTDEDEDRTYEVTWTANVDYELEPVNASLDSRPYMHIYCHPTGNYSFPTHRRGVQIVGKFGYCATGSYPEPINEACLLIAEKTWHRSINAPLGVMGSPEIGQVYLPSRDPELKKLLDPYAKVYVGAV